MLLQRLAALVDLDGAVERYIAAFEGGDDLFEFFDGLFETQFVPGLCPSENISICGCKWDAYRCAEGSCEVEGLTSTGHDTDPTTDVTGTDTGSGTETDGDTDTKTGTSGETQGTDTDDMTGGSTDATTTDTGGSGSSGSTGGLHGD